MLSLIVTSRLLSVILSIMHVTVSPSLIFSNSDVNLSLVSCFKPNDILSFSIFISKILVFNVDPALYSLISSSPLPSQLKSER